MIPLVAVIGPTAIGKTALGVMLCEKFGGEIVSADSRQFYRYMDIGTAKPTEEELARARHHLIDIADPDETVGLARFLRLARAAIAEVAQRDKIPFLVGGTGQYVRALLQGWRVPEVPPDPELRARLEQEAERDPAALWQRLMALDPDAADFIHPNNLRRVIRALEVSLKTGEPFSELRRRQPPPYRILKLGLTMDRAALYARADARVDAMIAAGLPQEVSDLLSRGYDWDLPAMSGLGYIQFKPYFEGEASLDDVVKRIKLDTHDFIRRQYTWFSLSAPDIHWLDTQDTKLTSRAVQLVADFLNQEPDRP
ncbi:MAG: tRNA (adenosine(37)-N6)-dimethylallyltransferase MiaA [Anaerolineae bacterium]